MPLTLLHLSQHAHESHGAAFAVALHYFAGEIETTLSTRDVAIEDYLETDHLNEDWRLVEYSVVQ